MFYRGRLFLTNARTQCTQWKRSLSFHSVCTVFLECNLQESSWTSLGAYNWELFPRQPVQFMGLEHVRTNGVAFTTTLSVLCPQLETTWNNCKILASSILSQSSTENDGTCLKSKWLCQARASCGTGATARLGVARNIVFSWSKNCISRLSENEGRCRLRNQLSSAQDAYNRPCIHQARRRLFICNRSGSFHWDKVMWRQSRLCLTGCRVYRCLQQEPCTGIPQTCPHVHDQIVLAAPLRRSYSQTFSNFRSLSIFNILSLVEHSSRTMLLRVEARVHSSLKNITAK